MKLRGIYARLRRKFYEGPDWLEVPPYLLSENYRSPTVMLSAWAWGLYIRFMTVPGQLLLLTSVMIMMYSLVLIQNPIIIFAFLLFSFFAADFLCGFVFRPRLEIKRRIPHRARLGTPFRIDYNVKNTRSVPAWDLELDAFRLREGLKYSASPASIEYLGAGKSVNLHTFAVASRRGRHYFASPIAGSLFPFCLFRWSCRVEQPHHILIYPKYEQLNSVSLPPGAKFQKPDLSLVSKIGESMDFLGCRKFRTGDNPRHIHWPSTARTGDLIVKEFREECLSRMALIIDTWGPEDNILSRLFGGNRQSKANFEAAISLAAAIADFTSRQDLVVDFFAAGPKFYHFQSGRSLSHLDDILDILAGISPNHKEPLIELGPSVMEEISGIGTAILIMLKWDASREDFVRKLQENGVRVKILVVGAKPLFESGLPENATFLKEADIAEGKVREL